MVPFKNRKFDDNKLEFNNEMRDERSDSLKLVGR